MGAIVAPGTVATDILFDLPLDPAELTAEDVELVNLFTGEQFTPTTYSLDPSGTSLHVEYASLRNGDCAPPPLSGLDGLRSLGGQQLDGDADGTVGDDYVLDFMVVNATPTILSVTACPPAAISCTKRPPARRSIWRWMKRRSFSTPMPGSHLSVSVTTARHDLSVESRTTPPR